METASAMAAGPRDFPILERYYRDPRQNWSLNWTEMTLLAAGAVLAALILVTWALGFL